MERQGLTDEQFDEVLMAAEAMIDDAKPSSNDDTIRQLCFTMHDCHWLATYWRTIDDLMDDSWTNYVTPIIGFGVGRVIEDMPCASNVTVSEILMNDGKVVEVVHVDEDEEEE